MRINRSDLEAAVARNIIRKEQAEQLEAFLEVRYRHQPSMNFTHVLWYMGALIAISAMSLFMTLGWESFGGAGILVTSLIYAVIALWLTQWFSGKDYPIPAGICATLAVTMVPLAVYGVQQMIGFWPDDVHYQDYHRKIKWHWIWVEVTTLLAGVAMLRVYRYPFLVMPIAITLWYMSMDIAPLLATDEMTFEFRAQVSLVFGLLITLLALRVDFISEAKADYAFWLYLAGVTAFWGGMSALDSDSELNRFIYFVINIAMILAGVLLRRKVFVVYGALGGCFYLGYLADKIFADSWLFPITLSAIGLGIIALGIHWQKHEARYTRVLRSCLPVSVDTWLKDKRS
ncbi:DUF2157 domain-containing protein [Oceanospirillum sediminis]|uniref:DUF2157 domain-containing protein n=1 Tax=Oceanospirillum sediminis TaxID=2760088 RepID=A0A839IN43_9GAMM|nr:DUF2157 domain-containing protein [Oceanospirillum sediminis]MBB1486114.1 DUF2157 domain-containing protein [Oceanospirillum sediminis]